MSREWPALNPGDWSEVDIRRREDTDYDVGVAAQTVALTRIVDNISVLPVGMVSPYAGTAAPSGWLICDGTAVSRDTYANLFTVIGTTYGSGNGTSTFNVPDLRQRFPLGKAASGTGATLGGTGGTISHTHAHSHGASVSITDAADHDHSFSGTSGTPASGNAAATGSGNNAGGGHTHSAGSFAVSSGGAHGHSGSASTDEASGTSATPPFLALNYIIRTG